jgi:hypothetical protein
MDMKKGFRLVVTHEEYDPNAATGMLNEVNAVLCRLVSPKVLLATIKTIDADNTKTVDSELATSAAAVVALAVAHDAQEQVQVMAQNAAIAHWDQLAHAAQIAAGPRPLAHVLVPFAPPPAPAGFRDARIAALRAQPLSDFLVMTLSSGASIADLYMKPADALGSMKLATSHCNALLAAQPLLLATIAATTVVQLHALVMTKLAQVVLDFWRATVQGYTPADLEKARIVAIQAVLSRPVSIATTHDDVQAHWDAFSELNQPGAVGFNARLVASVVSVAEPKFRDHLTSTVLDDTLVAQAELGVTTFVRYVVSQAKLAAAKATVVDAQVHPAVAALQVVIASLHADHNRLELRLREHDGRDVRDQHEQRDQRQRSNQRALRGQVVGSPDYTGCRKVLAGGRICGVLTHNEANHPT